MSCPLRYATKRELPPNISAYPVARRVVMQAVNNTWNRVRHVLSGAMTLEELEEANLNLALWLYDTFTGKNTFFVASYPCQTLFCLEICKIPDVFSDTPLRFIQSLTIFTNKCYNFAHLFY